MKIKDIYPLVVVEDPATVRDWYVRHLGFSVAIDVGWFIYVVSPGKRRFGLSFMREGLDHQLPQFRTRMTGDAVVVTIEVEDVESALAEVSATGAVPMITIRDEPWGQRHFMLRDPAGVWVDVVQEIEPDPMFADENDHQQLGTPPTETSD